MRPRRRRKPSPERSAVMRAVKSRDTAPELAVRKLLRAIAPRLPAVPRRPARQARHRLSGAEARDLCARLLLAWPRLRARRPHAQDQRRPTGATRSRAIAPATRPISRRSTALGWRALTIYECELEGPEALRAQAWRSACIDILARLHHVCCAALNRKSSEPASVRGSPMTIAAIRLSRSQRRDRKGRAIA